MSEVGTRPPAARGGAVLQQWLRRHLWRTEVQQALLPAVGTTVGGYHLEARRGAGGFGTVYRARRGGRLYALKFIYLPRTGSWGWRELEVLLKLRRVGTLPLEGHGHWPDKQPLFLFLAMEYVDGRPLYPWARDTPLTARQVARLVGGLAQQLVAVHSQGVVHRDVKGDNVVVRAADGVAVLVDFGVGTYPGAPKLTGPVLPGTAAYRSPEALRFRRQRAPGERYEASGMDDLWALGVVLYRLLTGRYPFDGDEAELEDGILLGEPLPPHTLNPQLPPALGALCLRLLAKTPEARCPDARAVCAALEAVLKEAEADATWDVPLRQDWSPLPDSGLSSPQERLPGTTRAVPDTSDRLETEEATPRAGSHRGRVWLGAALSLGLMALLVALAVRPSEEAEDRQPLAPHSPFGQEFAPQGQTPQFAGGAAPPWAPTPAPVARATTPEDTGLKTSIPALPQKKTQPKHRGTLAKTVTTLAACSALAGCTGGTQAVRTGPPPEDCPPEALKVMEEMGFTKLEFGNQRFHYYAAFKHQGRFWNAILTIQPGPVNIYVLQDMGKLEGKHTVREANLELSGQLIAGKERMYGRFTRLHDLKSGTFYPVCMELATGNGTRGEGRRGVPLKPGSTPEAPRLSSMAYVRTVKRFEED